MKYIMSGARGDVGSILFRMLEKSGNKCVEYSSDQTGGDVFLHLASKSQFRHPDEVTLSNITFLHEVIEYCSKNNIRKLVFFSAMSVYGNIDKEKLGEDEPLFAPNLYSTSKYLGELILKESDLEVLVLRLPAVLGTRNVTNFFGRTLTKIKNNQKVELSNADRLFNNFINIEKIAEFICNYPFENKFDVVNLASKIELSLYDVVKLIALKAGSDSEIIKTDEVRNFFNISTKKAETSYGFVPNGAEVAIESWFKIMKEYS